MQLRAARTRYPKVFRLGHMGTVDFRDLAAGFAAIGTELTAMGHRRPSSAPWPGRSG